MQKPHLPELIFFFILLAGSALGAYLVLSPYFVPIFLGAVLAILMRPVYRMFHTKLPGKPSLAAGTSTFLAIVIVLFPLLATGFLLTNEVSNSAALGGTGHSFASLMGSVKEYANHVMPGAGDRINASDFTDKITSFITSNVENVVSGTASVGLDMFLMLVTLFFLLRDGHKLHAFALAWSPLPDRYDRTIIARVTEAVTAVVKGTLLTALAQGLFAGVGFAVFGVENPILWGAVCILAAFIPIVGTAIVIAPWVIYFFAIGDNVGAVGLFLWSLVLTSGIDNVLRPMLIRGGLNVHPLLILLSVIGGLSAFGPVGFIAGPVVFALFFALLELYPEVVKGRIEKIENSRNESAGAD